MKKTPSQLKHTFIKNYPQLEYEKYLKWTKVIYQKYEKCICCLKKKKKQAHHIVPKTVDIKKAYDSSNGVVMCFTCHRRYHKAYPISKINMDTLKEFVREERKKIKPKRLKPKRSI